MILFMSAKFFRMSQPPVRYRRERFRNSTENEFLQKWGLKKSTKTWCQNGSKVSNIFTFFFFFFSFLFLFFFPRASLLN